VSCGVADVRPEILEGLVAVLELQAGDPQQQVMLARLSGDLPLPAESVVLVVGCGTGGNPNPRTWSGVERAVRVDSSPTFIQGHGGACGEVLLERCSKIQVCAREFIRKRLAEGGKRNGLAAFWAEYGALQL
jgi:hypothetical protein